MVNVNIINKSRNELPSYSTAHAAGMDLRADVPDCGVMLFPGGRTIIPTGLYIELPVGYEAQIRSRSGLAIKNGVVVLNGVGTIDADYRGEIGVILINTSNIGFIVNPGDRIAQMVIAAHETAVWNKVEELGTTDRGDGGFGSTNIK